MSRRSDEQLLGLPETKSASKGARVKLDALLREAHSLRHVEARLKEIKKELSELVQAQGLGDGERLGCRVGQFCCVVRFQAGKRSLDRAMLVENGVTPEQLEASMKEGAGYWVIELPEIGGD